MKKKIILALFILTTVMKSFSQQVIPLYKQGIPNSKPTKDEESSKTENGMLIISNISRPTLTLYLPPKAKANGTAVVICPGGGYWINAAGHEGAAIAKKLNEWGIAAFVLKYRIPNDAIMLNKEIGPLQDAQQAIKLVRDNAMAWQVNPNRVGIMGFSAGGHLASTAGTHYKHVVIPNTENTKLRPDFMVLGYPVVSFQDNIGHIGSRDQLIGKNPSQQKKDEYSNEMQVTDDTPPTFLVHAGDDDAVPVQNSIVFYDALQKHHVPAEMHIYQAGGHGFGLNNKTTKDQWIERLRNWLDGNGWLKK